MLDALAGWLGLVLLGLAVGLALLLELLDQTVWSGGPGRSPRRRLRLRLANLLLVVLLALVGGATVVRLWVIAG